MISEEVWRFVIGNIIVGIHNLCLLVHLVSSFLLLL